MSVGHAARSVLALNLGSASLKAASYALPASADARRTVGRETGRISVETAHPASTAPGENSRDHPRARFLAADGAHGCWFAAQKKRRDDPGVFLCGIAGGNRSGPWLTGA